jgi:hypothetical protein
LEKQKINWFIDAENARCRFGNTKIESKVVMKKIILFLVDENLMTKNYSNAQEEIINNKGNL